MTKATKTALLVIGGVLIAFAVLVGAGVWWVTSNWEGMTDNLANKLEEVRVEAAVFAAEHEQKDCMPQARTRARACTLSPTCMVDGTMFFEFCLEGATVSPGLCDGVPMAAEEVDGWPEQRCRELDRARELSCPLLHAVLQGHCYGRESDG